MELNQARDANWKIAEKKKGAYRRSSSEQPGRMPPVPGGAADLLFNDLERGYEHTFNPRASYQASLRQKLLPKRTGSYLDKK